MTKIKQGKSGCGCLPLTIFAVISLGAGYYFGRNLLGSELTPKSSAKITPQSAFVTSYISTNTKKWSELNEFVTPSTQEMIRGKLEDFANQNLQENEKDINYEKDIAPWLGGASIVLLPSSNSGIDLQPVTILGIKNQFQAWRFFSRQEKIRDSEIEKTKYKKITIYNVPEYNVWATVFGSYLILSDDQDGIKQVIDTHKGEASLNLSDSPNNFSQNPLFQVYFPEYDRFLLKTLEDLSPNFDGNRFSQSPLGKVNSMAMNLTVEDYGLNFKTIFNLDEKTASKTNQLKNISDDLLAQIPEETIFMVNGGNIDKMWQNILEEQKNIPELDQLISEIRRGIFNSLNLDLEKNIISWLDGEFIFSISDISNTQIKGSMLLESSNKNEGNSTLNKLTNIAKRSSFFKINNTKLKGIEVTEVTNYGQNLLSYGWLNKNNLLVTFGYDFQKIADLNKKNSLLNNETFKLTTESLPTKNYGYFYLDLEKTLANAQSINPEMFNNVPPEIKAVSESLKAIAITSSSPDSNSTQLDINLSLQTNTQ